MKQQQRKLADTYRKRVLIAALQLCGEDEKQEKYVLYRTLVQNKLPSVPMFPDKLDDEAVLNYLEKLYDQFLSTLTSSIKEVQSFHSLREEFINLKNRHEKLKSQIADLLGAALPETPYAHLGDLLNDPILQKMSLPITDAGLSIRALNICLALDIKTVGDLTRFTPNDLLKQRNCGKSTVAEISAMLEANNLRWSATRLKQQNNFK